jgi:hypothetical protein
LKKIDSSSFHVVHSKKILVTNLIIETCKFINFEENCFESNSNTTYKTRPPSISKQLNWKFYIKKRNENGKKYSSLRWKNEWKILWMEDGLFWETFWKWKEIFFFCIQILPPHIIFTIHPSSSSTSLYFYMYIEKFYIKHNE